MAIHVTYGESSFQCDSLEAFREKLISLSEGLSEQTSVVAELDGGEYLLKRPFSLSSVENPSLSNLRLTLRAADNEAPVISSLAHIDGKDFKKVEGKPYYTYSFDKNETGEYPVFRDLYSGGKRLKFSASPIYKNPYALLKEERSGEKALEGIYAPYDMAKALLDGGVTNTELFMYIQWEYAVLRVTGVDLSVTKEKDGVTYALITFDPTEFDRYYVRGVHSLNNTGNRPTFFQNSVAFLEEGSFAYVHSTGTLYVYPDSSTDMDDTVFSYPTLDTLFVLEGLAGTAFEGLTFTGVSATFLSKCSYLAPLSNVVAKKPYAAILGKNMRDTTVDGCHFSGIGCNAVQLNGRTVTARVLNSRFTDIGGFGVVIGGYEGGTWQLPNPAVASEEEMKRFFATATYDVYIENNYLEHIGYDYPNSAAIYFGSVDGAKILHNTVIDCAYSGISLGWGWQAFFVPGELFNLRAVEIAYNRVHNFMQLLRDGGAIYTYGANSITSHATRFNATHHNYASLEDAGDKDKRGYYLDCSTSNWDVYENVIDNCFIPYFAQYHVKHENPHHVRLDRNYSTTPISELNHAPERDVLMSDCFVCEGSIEDLFKAYPYAKEICDNAGCDL